MNTDHSVYWYDDSDVGDEVGRVVNGVVYSDFDTEVKNSDIEVSEIEVREKVGSAHVIDDVTMKWKIFSIVIQYDIIMRLCFGSKFLLCLCPICLWYMLWLQFYLFVTYGDVWASCRMSLSWIFLDKNILSGLS